MILFFWSQNKSSEPREGSAAEKKTYGKMCLKGYLKVIQRL